MALREVPRDRRGVVSRLRCGPRSSAGVLLVSPLPAPAAFTCQGVQQRVAVPIGFHTLVIQTDAFSADTQPAHHSTGQVLPLAITCFAVRLSLPLV